MKSSLLFIALLCALTLSSSASSVSNAANAAQKDRAVTRFDQPVELMGVTLKGEYLFVHDDAAMMRGETCTFVYKGGAETLNNLVVALHCMPATRVKVTHFTVRTFVTPAGQNELREFQFAGSSEAHVVPVMQHAAYVNIARQD